MPRARNILLSLWIAGAACTDDPATVVPPPPAGATSALRSLVARPDSVAVIYLPSERALRAVSPRGVELWRVTLPGSGRVIGDLVVAPNSAVYLRTVTRMLCYGAGGELAWSHELPAAASADRLYTPAAMTNSGAVVAATPQHLVAFDHRGVQMWEADLPLGESLVAPPSVLRDGTIVAVGQQFAVALHPDGKAAWQTSLAAPRAAR